MPATRPRPPHRSRPNTSSSPRVAIIVISVIFSAMLSVALGAYLWHRQQGQKSKSRPEVTSLGVVRDNYPVENFKPTDELPPYAP
jgi:hypothetical protein